VDRRCPWIEPRTPVLEAISLLRREEGLPCALVGTPARLLGVLTERVVVEALLRTPDLRPLVVGELFAAPALTQPAGDCRDAQATLAWMEEHQLQVLPVLDDGGTVVGIVTREALLGHLPQRIVYDQPAMALALEQSEQKYRKLVDALDGIVWEVHPANFQFLFVSPQAEKILGYPLDAWLEPDFWVAHLHPEDRERSIQFCLEATRAFQDHEFEYRMIAADGRVVWLYDKTTVVVEDGQVVKLVGLMIDITPQRQAQVQLQEGELAYRALVENSPDIIERFDLKLRHLYVSPRLTELTGVPGAAFLGRSCREMGMDAAMVETWEAAAHALMATGSKQTIEFEAETLEGVRAFEMVLAPERDLDDRLASILCISRDITERKRMEQQLREQAVEQAELYRQVRAELHERQRTEAELIVARDQAQAANRAKNQFLATMSHEIRTPLNAVIGMTSLLQTMPLCDEQQRLVATIRQGGEVLLAIVTDMLDFARIEAGKLELLAEPFDLHATLQDIVALLRGRALEKQLDLSLHLAPQTPKKIVGDATRLKQILLNLLGNALKFTEVGFVSLRVDATPVPLQRDTFDLQFAVQDTACGIADDKLELIFQPFQQGDSSINRRYGGTGLGLAICRRLCDLMDGQIRVESRLGEGSTFFVTLRFVVLPPDEPVAPVRFVPRVPQMAATLPLEMLVVEDNPVNQMVLGALLRRLGYQPAMADNGLQAMAALERQHFDVVLMDIEMPEMDGLTATQHIRACYDDRVRIVGISARAYEDSRQSALDSGMDAYLTKPIQLDALVRVLQQVAQPG
jgi:PAS domain S-box-containing protein